MTLAGLEHHPLAREFLAYELANAPKPTALETLYAAATPPYWEHVQAELERIVRLEGRSLAQCLQDLTLFNESGAELENDAWYDRPEAFVSMHLDFLALGFSRRRTSELIDQLSHHLPDGGTLCDVGSGCGYFGTQFIERFPDWKLTLIDRSSAARTYARRDLGDRGLDDRSTILEGDIESLPAADESFDVIVAAEVLEHAHDGPKAAQELRRVLRPGGILGVSVPIELDIPMHPIVFPNAESVIEFFADFQFESLEQSVVAPEPTDAVAHALPDFEGCVHAIFRKGGA